MRLLHYHLIGRSLFTSLFEDVILHLFMYVCIALLHRKGDGAFLVRLAERFHGEYSLTFLHNDEVNHARIRVRNKSYFLTDEVRPVDILSL